MYTFLYKELNLTVGAVLICASPFSAFFPSHTISCPLNHHSFLPVPWRCYKMFMSLKDAFWCVFHAYTWLERSGGGVVTDLILFLSSLAKHHVFKTDLSSCYVLIWCVAAVSGFLSLRTLTFGAGSFFLWGLPYALWGDQQYPVGASCAFSPAVTLKTVSRHWQLSWVSRGKISLAGNPCFPFHVYVWKIHQNASFKLINIL